MTASATPSPLQGSLFPKLQVSLPPEPQVNGQNVESLLKGDRNQAFEHFKNMSERALRDIQITRNSASPAQERFAAEASLNANPVAPTIISFVQEYERNPNKADGQTMFDLRTDKVVRDYMKGIDLGSEDPAVSEGRNSAFQQLVTGGGIFAALRTFAMTLPFVATIKRWVQAKMAGEEMSFSEAAEANIKQKAYTGAAMMLKIDPDLLQADAKQPLVEVEPFVAPARTTPVAPVAPKTTVPATDASKANIELDEQFNALNDLPLPVKEKVIALQANGKIVLGEPGKPALATAEAVEELNRLPNVPKNGNSVAKIEK